MDNSFGATLARAMSLTAQQKKEVENRDEFRNNLYCAYTWIKKAACAGYFNTLVVFNVVDGESLKLIIDELHSNGFSVEHQHHTTYIISWE